MRLRTTASGVLHCAEYKFPLMTSREKPTKLIGAFRTDNVACFGKLPLLIYAREFGRLLPMPHLRFSLLF
jgi:hypothetical protein